MSGWLASLIGRVAMSVQLQFIGEATDTPAERCGAGQPV